MANPQNQASIRAVLPFGDDEGVVRAERLLDAAVKRQPDTHGRCSLEFLLPSICTSTAMQHPSCLVEWET